MMEDEDRAARIAWVEQQAQKFIESASDYARAGSVAGYLEEAERYRGDRGGPARTSAVAGRGKRLCYGEGCV
jgi:hypothetical protein